MSYDETRLPTSPERETIYHAFRDVLKQCYPNCRYLNDKIDDNIYVRFFCEVQIEEDEDEDKEGKRVGALVGGQGAEVDDLHLLINIEKWRAQPSEHRTLLLIHEATHIEYPNHGDGFWESFVNNIQTVLDQEEECTSLPYYTERDLCIAAVQHPTSYSCDGEWTRYKRQEWLVEQLPYSEEDFRDFEKLSHPISDHSEFGEYRQQYDKAIDADTDLKPRISFYPIRNGKFSNMTLCPEYIESPNILGIEIKTYLNDLREAGYPPIPVPIVELAPSGQYHIIDGGLSVAVAQRIGFIEIGVVNQDQDYQTVEQYLNEKGEDRTLHKSSSSH